MTKKHYEMFAAEFKAFRGIGPYTCPDTLALMLRVASLFQRDNPRFDRQKFLLASGFRREDAAKM